jgi:hypothetical protein
MATLSPLPVLPMIQAASPYGTLATDPSTGAPIPDTYQAAAAAASAASSVSGAINSAASKMTKAASRLIFGFDLEDLVFILLGLMLIGAALYSFKPTQQIVQTVTRAARDAAVAAA